MYSLILHVCWSLRFGIGCVTGFGGHGVIAVYARSQEPEATEYYLRVWRVIVGLGLRAGREDHFCFAWPRNFPLGRP
jgi:hypothetical protein